MSEQQVSEMIDTGSYPIMDEEPQGTLEEGNQLAAEAMDGAQETIPQGEAKDGQPKPKQEKPEGEFDNKFSADEEKAIQKWLKKWDIPKGVEPVMDKGGNLHFLVKINGQTYPVKPNDLIKGFSLNQAGYQKLNEAKTLIKSHEEENNRRRDMWVNKKDPSGYIKFLESQNLNPEEIAMRILEEKTKYTNMTQEERERYEAQKRMEEREKDLEERELAIKESNHKQKIAEIRNKFAKEIDEAVTKRGFNKTLKLRPGEQAQLILEAVNTKQAYMKSGSDISFYEALGLAHQKFQSSFNTMLQQFDDDHIIKMLPERVVKKILDDSVKKLHDSDVGVPINMPRYPKKEQAVRKKFKLSDF